jgi:hypothetical protein
MHSPKPDGGAPVTLSPTSLSNSSSPNNFGKKSCRTSTVPSRQSSIDSELERHFSHSLSEHRPQSRPITNADNFQHSFPPELLDGEREDFNASNWEHVREIWRPYMV